MKGIDDEVKSRSDRRLVHFTCDFGTQLVTAISMTD